MFNTRRTERYSAYAQSIDALSEAESVDKDVERQALVKATRDALGSAIDDNREHLRTAPGGAS